MRVARLLTWGMRWDWTDGTSIVMDAMFGMGMGTRFGPGIEIRLSGTCEWPRLCCTVRTRTITIRLTSEISFKMRSLRNLEMSRDTNHSWLAVCEGDVCRCGVLRSCVESVCEGNAGAEM